MKELIEIQKKLKAPKNQYNKFGGYNYRNAEDILNAVKPLLAENGCFLMLSDSIENIGERYYLKATAKLYNGEGQSIEVSALAREDENKKGMDGAQITGAASSYARKYALNGLFLIDDTKDADTEEYKTQKPKKDDVEEKIQQKKEEVKKETAREKLIKYVKAHGLDMNEVARDYKLNCDTTEEQFGEALKHIKGE